MFYTGLDPYTLEPVYIAKDPKEKAMQRALLQYYKPENQRKIIEALEKAGRRDLIGNGQGKLVAPDREYMKKQQERKAVKSNVKSNRVNKNGKKTQNNRRKR